MHTNTPLHTTYDAKKSMHYNLIGMVSWYNLLKNDSCNFVSGEIGVKNWSKQNR